MAELTEEQSGLLAAFSELTGADHETASHVLEAHGWDLNAGVDFFLENGSRPPPPAVPPTYIDETIIIDEDIGPGETAAPDGACLKGVSAARPGRGAGCSCLVRGRDGVLGEEPETSSYKDHVNQLRPRPFQWLVLCSRGLPALHPCFFSA